MKTILLKILKRLSSKALFFILRELTTTLQGRDDNSMNRDANRIKKLLLNNFVYEYGKKK